MGLRRRRFEGNQLVPELSRAHNHVMRGQNPFDPHVRLAQDLEMRLLRLHGRVVLVRSFTIFV